MKIGTKYRYNNGNVLVFNTYDYSRVISERPFCLFFITFSGLNDRWSERTEIDTTRYNQL